MGTIQPSSALLSSAPNLSSPRPVVRSLESKIGAKEEEMDFYHKLLSWLLLSCREEKRHVIETFRNELADLRGGGFSALAKGLEQLKNEAQSEAGQSDVWSDLAHFQLYFNHIDAALQSLKSKIHRGFGDFTHVCIW